MKNSELLAPKLHKFLKKHHVVKKFIANYKSTTKQEDIISAFVWSDTPEEYGFWNDLHKKFYKEMD